MIMTCPALSSHQPWITAQSYQTTKVLLSQLNLGAWEATWGSWVGLGSLTHPGSYVLGAESPDELMEVGLLLGHGSLGGNSGAVALLYIAAVYR